MPAIQQEGLHHEKPRVKSLDSLRGLAALTVVISHCLNNLTYSPLIDRSPLYIFKAAHEAVIFFFLLSGYVLVYQYEQKNTFRYGEFLLLRFCRIYLPYIASILFCGMLYILVQPKYFDHTFLGSFWHLHLTTAMILNHLLLISNFNTDAFDPVIWSLVHEMRVAIIFPALLYIIRLKPQAAVITAFLIALISSVLIVLNVEPSKGFLNGYCYTLYYVPIFILGGLIVKYQLVMAKFYEGVKAWQKIVLIVVALILYTYAHTIPFTLRELHLELLSKFTFALQDLVTIIGAAGLLIIALAESRRQTFLNNKIPLFLGKISYSLYLVHLPILIFFYKELEKKESIFVIYLIAITASLIVSGLFNFVIERNAMKLGKRLTVKFH